MGTPGRMNALRLARVAPTAARSFQTSAPRQGLGSTLGGIGVLGILASPSIPGVGPQLEAMKDEHKVLAWIAGMTVCGTLASLGGGSSEAPAAEEVDFDALLKELEEKK